MRPLTRLCLVSTAILASLTTSTALAQNNDDAKREDAVNRMVDRIMQRDANGDGKLSKDELPGPMAAQIFSEGDANNDGMLDPDELKSFLAKRAAAQPGGRPGGVEPGRKVQPGQPGRLKGPKQGLERKNTPAFDRGRPGAIKGSPRTGGKEMDFEDYMKVAGRALRKLRKSPLDASSRKKDLAAIEQIQFGLLNAKMRIATVEMAPQAKERYGDNKDEYLQDFHMALTQTLMESFNMEMALLEGNTAKARESLEYLRQAQKKGHEAFQEDEDDEDEAHEAREHEEHEHSGRDDDDDDDD